MFYKSLPLTAPPLAMDKTQRQKIITVNTMEAEKIKDLLSLPIFACGTVVHFNLFHDSDESQCNSGHNNNSSSRVMNTKSPQISS